MESLSMKNLNIIAFVSMLLIATDVISMEEQPNDIEQLSKGDVDYQVQDKKPKGEVDEDRALDNEKFLKKLEFYEEDEENKECGWDSLPTEVQLRILSFVLNAKDSLDSNSSRLRWNLFKQLFILKLINKPIRAMTFDKQVFDLKAVAKQIVLGSMRELVLIASSIKFRPLCKQFIKLGCFDGINLALINAIYFHDLELVSKLIELKRSRASLSDGTNEIMIAAAVGDAQILKLLLDCELTDVNDRNSHLSTALIYACLCGSKDTVKLLLDNNANVNDKDNFNSTGLMVALCRGDKEITELLLDKGANVNEKNSLGNNPMIFVACYGGIELARLLLDKVADVNEQNNKGAAALSYAAENGHKDIVEFLLDNNAEVNMQNNKNETPLMFASWKGHIEIVELLLERQADVNAESNDGKTALIIAAVSGQTRVVKLLLDKGALIDKKNNEGKTALMLAAEKGHTSIVKLLLDKGAGASIEMNDNDDTALALALAISNEHQDIAELLQNYITDQH